MDESTTNDQPMITAVIPTYRRPQLLRRAVLSVLNQTYPNLRVCVYDNASGDSTAEIVQELSRMDPRVSYYCHPQDIGAVNNFNFGLSRVVTPYFSILSDDDILLPDFYEKAIAGFQKYPEAGFIATETISSTNDEIKDVSFKSYEERLYQLPEGLLKMSQWEATGWTGILFRQEVVKAVGLLVAEIFGPMDGDFMLRVTALSPYAVIKSPGAIFLVHGTSVSSSWSEADALEGYLQVLDRARNNPDIPVALREEVYQNIKSDVIRTLWLSGVIDIKKRNFLAAHKIARSLKADFGADRQAIILKYISKWCELSPLFYHAFIGLNQIRKRLNIREAIRKKKLQKAYRPYLKYLG